MLEIKQWVETFAILAKYGEYPDFYTAAEHDEFWVGIPENISDADKDRLDELGWQVVFDSAAIRMSV